MLATPIPAAPGGIAGLAIPNAPPAGKPVSPAAGPLAAAFAWALGDALDTVAPAPLREQREQEPECIRWVAPAAVDAAAKPLLFGTDPPAGPAPAVAIGAQTRGVTWIPEISTDLAGTAQAVEPVHRGAFLVSSPNIPAGNAGAPGPTLPEQLQVLPQAAIPATAPSAASRRPPDGGDVPSAPAGLGIAARLTPRPAAGGGVLDARADAGPAGRPHATATPGPDAAPAPAERGDARSVPAPVLPAAPSVRIIETAAGRIEYTSTPMPPNGLSSAPRAIDTPVSGQAAPEVEGPPESAVQPPFPSTAPVRAGGDGNRASAQPHTAAAPREAVPQPPPEPPATEASFAPAIDRAATAASPAAERRDLARPESEIQRPVASRPPAAPAGERISGHVRPRQQTAADWFAAPRRTGTSTLAPKAAQDEPAFETAQPREPENGPGEVRTPQRTAIEAPKPVYSGPARRSTANTAGVPAGYDGGGPRPPATPGGKSPAGPAPGEAAGKGEPKPQPLTIETAAASGAAVKSRVETPAAHRPAVDPAVDSTPHGPENAVFALPREAREPSTSAAPRAEGPAPLGIRSSAGEPAPSEAPEPVRDIRLRLSGQRQERVELQLRDRGGEIKVAVRTPDVRLSEDLRAALPHLGERLERGGYATETWRPEPPAARADVGAGMPDDGSHSRGGGHQDGRERQQQQPGRPAWVEELEDHTNGKEFAWFVSTVS